LNEPASIGGPARQNRSAPEPWRVLHPTGEHLRVLAFHGHAGHVRALFEAMTPAERARHADPEVLHQVVLGGLARVHTLPAGAAVELERERAFLETVTRLFVAECRSRGVFPRELFRTLLDWSDELLRASRLNDANDACELAVALGVNAFPEIWPWIQLGIARTQVLLGNLEGAHARLLETYRRLDRIADRKAVPALLDTLGTVSLETRRARLFKRLLVERLRAFHTDGDERRTVVRLMQRANRGILGVLASGDLSTADKLLWLTHWTSLGAAQRVGWRPAARLFEKCATVGAYVGQYGLRSDVSAGSSRTPRTIEATLVTRAMGGIGDFLMMTPGLRALKALRARRPVLAIPRRFFPLFEGNDDVELMDIDDDFDPGAYEEWFNLTDCPAARVESRTAPAVRDNRIKLFARGLGITGRRLKDLDRRPRYTVSAAELKWRDQYFADHGLRDAWTVGVQPGTDESYRDVPHMRQIVEALAQHASVLVFGRLLPAGVEKPRVIQAQGLNLRRSFALASGCDVLVTPDSAFFHLAGALDLPCVGLFGPTDGRVRGQDYPRARIVDARRTLPCVPCWRNEVIPCGLTGLRPSACLGEIAPADVVRAVQESAATASRRQRAAG
jgi:ADP-heptose:LPS heptosyltransferase